MEKTKITVYVKTDENGVITAINSGAFLKDTDGWTEIDDGTGDKYAHAQNHYLDKPLTDKNGLYNYKLVNGVPTERTNEDKAPELAVIESQAEIAKLKDYLISTDYIAAKLAEGAAIKEEYADELAHRAYWRTRINELGG